MKKVLLGLVLVFFATTAFAQGVDQYNLRIYPAGGGAVIVGGLSALPATSFTCNQTASTSTSTTNPDKMEFDDPVNVGKVCRYTDNGSGPLLSMKVFGNFEATLTAVATAAVGGAVESAESNRAPFRRTPAAPGTYRVVR